MNSVKLVAGLLISAAAGAIIGVLFAPDKGTETRKKISKKGTDLTDSLKQKFNDFVDKVSDNYGEVREEIQEEMQTIKERSKGKPKRNDIAEAGS
jgi:gas vesicle protein